MADTDLGGREPGTFAPGVLRSGLARASIFSKRSSERGLTGSSTPWPRGPANFCRFGRYGYRNLNLTHEKTRVMKIAEIWQPPFFDPDLVERGECMAPVEAIDLSCFLSKSGGLSVAILA